MAESITVAGGGLVGSLLALILARKGMEVEVYESRPDMRKTNISAGRSINLALANRGIKPLAELGLMEKVNKLLIPMRGRMVHVEGEPSVLQPYGQSEQEVIYSISRGELNSLLLSEAENTGLVKIHFEYRIQSVDLGKNELVMSNGEQQIARHFNRVIGTDGANSVIRDAILAAQQSELSVDVLDHAYKELHISPDNDGEHKIEKEALHIWPRGNFMLIALPNLDGSFTLTLFMPTEGEVSFEALHSDSEIMAFFSQHFAQVTPIIENLLETFKQNPTGKLATVKCSPWAYDDKALLLGDAAHAIVPFHGQGMNCGFEDCQAMADALNENAPEQVQWSRLFSEVANQRKPNADAIADMALENYVEMRDSVMQSDFLLKKQFAFQLQQWFPKRFSPRYAMVMFEHRPYSEAFSLGEIHQQLLTELCDVFGQPQNMTEKQAVGMLEKYGL